jgi:hypothetical protein
MTMGLAVRQRRNPAHPVITTAGLATLSRRSRVCRRGGEGSVEATGTFTAQAGDLAARSGVPGTAATGWPATLPVDRSGRAPFWRIDWRADGAIGASCQPFTMRHGSCPRWRDYGSHTAPSWAKTTRRGSKACRRSIQSGTDGRSSAWRSCAARAARTSRPKAVAVS